MLLDRLRDLREDKDLSQSQIAELLGITQRAYSYYERSERVIPLELLIKLADFYGVSVDYILNRTNEK